MRVVAWTVSDASGRRSYRAPAVLCPLTILQRGAAQEGFELALTGDAMANGVLTHVLRSQYGLAIDDQALSLPEGGPEALRRHVEQVIRRVAEGRLADLSFEDCLAASAFVYEKLPIEHDLQNAGDLLTSHNVVACIAGDAATLVDLKARASFSAFAAGRRADGKSAHTAVYPPCGTSPGCSTFIAWSPRGTGVDEFPRAGSSSQNVAAGSPERAEGLL